MDIPSDCGRNRSLGGPQERFLGDEMGCVFRGLVAGFGDGVERTYWNWIGQASYSCL